MVDLTPQSSKMLLNTERLHSKNIELNSFCHTSGLVESEISNFETHGNQKLH